MPKNIITYYKYDTSSGITESQFSAFSSRVGHVVVCLISKAFIFNLVI